MKIGVYMESSCAGGADTSLINIVKSWPNKNDRFIVFCNKTHPGLQKIKKELVSGAFFVDLKFPLYIDLFLAVERKATIHLMQQVLKLLLRLLRLPLFLYQVALLKKIILAGKPELLIINNGGYPGAESCCAAAVAAAMGKIKVIMVINGEPRKLKFKFFRLYEQFLDWMVNRSVSLFISVSEAVKKAINRNRFLYIDKIKTIYNAVALPDCLNPEVLSKDNFNVGIIANICPNKGHGVLFKATDILLKRDIPIKVHVVGKGAPAEELRLRDLVVSMKLTNSIQFMGYIDNVYDFMSGLDMVVVPSLYYESFGLVAIEAMALGVVVVASRIGGLPEIIEHGENGLLFESGNEKDLAETIEDVFRHSNLRIKLTENGRKIYCEKFTVDRMGGEYYKHITEVLY